MGFYLPVFIDDNGFISKKPIATRLNDPTGYAPGEAHFGVVTPPDNPVRLAANTPEPEIGWLHSKVVNFEVVDMTQEDEDARTAAELAKWQARQDAKSANLKDAENRMITWFRDHVPGYEAVTTLAQSDWDAAMFYIMQLNDTGQSDQFVLQKNKAEGCEALLYRYSGVLGDCAWHADIVE